ncbi:metal-sensitive transcriptional regulator [Desulfohalovibrio reitneri]|uniref:metal-sensitive transcriptional regulator n=1 Tax=Desulfohalovibrio reitneri TaxID=1307759 RepID=UPI0009DF2DB2|nr:metal-sensitive transcriptional regulator [Desulfohalovibrio reitneri]
MKKNASKNSVGDEVRGSSSQHYDPRAGQTQRGGDGAAQDEAPKLDDLQKDVLSRLKRIEGQVRGIQGMVRQGKECEDILIQVKAVSSALKSTTRQVLRRYVRTCHTRAVNAETEEEAAAQLEKTVKILTDFLDK